MFHWPVKALTRSTFSMKQNERNNHLKQIIVSIYIALVIISSTLRAHICWIFFEIFTTSSINYHLLSTSENHFWTWYQHEQGARQRSDRRSEQRTKSCSRWSADTPCLHGFSMAPAHPRRLLKKYNFAFDKDQKWETVTVVWKNKTQNIWTNIQRPL